MAKFQSSPRAARLAGTLTSLLLILGSPVLLFPQQVPVVTVLVLGMLAVGWSGEAVLRRPWPLTPLNGPLLVMLAMVGVGILVTPDPDLTLSKASGFILGIGLLRWAAGLHSDKLYRVAALLFMLAAIGTVGIGLLGAAQLFLPASACEALTGFLPTWLVALPDAPERGINPNQLAGVLTLLLPVPIAWALRVGPARISLPGRAAWTALAVLGAAALALTQSRSGWVGAAAGLLALLALAGGTSRQRWQRRAGVALLIVAVLGVAGFVAWQGPHQSLTYLDSIARSGKTVGGYVSMSARFEIWNRALQAIQDAPFTGCGLGAFRQVIWAVYPLFDIPFGRDLAHAHNVFLQIALDVGIPGLIAYLSLLGLAGAAALRVAWQDGEERWAALGWLSGLIGFHVYGLFDTLALGCRPHFLFWWMLGLLAALAGRSRSAVASADRPVQAD